MVHASELIPPQSDLGQQGEGVLAAAKVGKIEGGVGIDHSD
jgi:hypothetical protein